VDAYIQFRDIVKAGYAAAISPAIEQMTGKKPRSLNTGRATTLDGGHPQFVRFACVTPAAATVDVPHASSRNRKRRLDVAVLDCDDGRHLGGEVRVNGPFPPPEAAMT
jgi:hypothetical protein